jgi:hypothetical protein
MGLRGALCHTEDRSYRTNMEEPTCLYGHQVELQYNLPLANRWSDEKSESSYRRPSEGLCVDLRVGLVEETILCRVLL